MNIEDWKQEAARNHFISDPASAVRWRLVALVAAVATLALMTFQLL